MSNDNTNEINNMLEDIKPILNATQATISDMKDKERKPVKQIATMVGVMIGMQPVKVLPFVNYFAHNTKLGYVSPGRFGGFVRGIRPLQVVRVIPTTSDTSVIDTTDSDDTTDTTDETETE